MDHCSLWTNLLATATNAAGAVSAAGHADPYFWENLLHGFIGTLVYGLAGILLLALGFKVFDWLTPRMDIEKELTERQNIAVAIVCLAFVGGVSAIIAVAVH